MTTFATILRLRSILASSSLQGYKPPLIHVLRKKDSWQIGPAAAPGCRHLYTPSAMGIDGYIYHREKVAQQFQKLHDKFRQRMSEVLESDSQNMIFTEDLKNAVHLAEPTEDDISLVMGMAKKFNNQHSGLRFGAYVFGPVVMRMLHHLNKPDTSLQALRMEELDGFFDQLSSYQLSMDLLYEHGRYQDVLDIFNDLQGKRINGIKYPKNCMTIALGACYKMNTQESYETMVGILEGAQEYGSNLNLRCIMFSAALALNQGFPHVCLELLSRCSKVTHIVVRNLKVLSLTELGRVEDTLPVLRSILQFDLPDTHQRSEKSLVFRDTIVKVEHAIKETGNKELIAEFQHVLKNLEGNGFITEKNLDEFVSEPIEAFRPNSNMRQDRAMLAASFNRNSRNQRTRQGSNQRQRPGLMEME